MRGVGGLLVILWAMGVQAQTVTLQWTAPQTNADGTPLTDLAGYRLYQAMGTGSFTAVPPDSLETARTLTGLAPGSYRWRVTARDTSGNESVPSDEVGLLIEPPPLPGSITGLVLDWTISPCQAGLIDFEEPVPPGRSGDRLTGVYGGIDWGAQQWRWEGPFGPNPTRHVYFDSASGTSRTFTFADGPRILESLRAFTQVAGTLTLSDEQGQIHVQAISVGSNHLVTTGWRQPARSVTVAFTAGWELGVDDVAFGCP